MKNVKFSFESKKRLKERFGKTVSDLKANDFSLYCKGNINSCPYVTVSRKLLMSNYDNVFYLVSEKLNMMIAGYKYENKPTVFSTVMYLDGRDGYENINLKG